MNQIIEFKNGFKNWGKNFKFFSLRNSFGFSSSSSNKKII